MGYRSDIKIIAGKNAAKELLRVNNKYNLLTFTEGENDLWLFEADYVKWYEDDPDNFPDVAAVMKVVDKYRTKSGKENGICYYRNGESDDDSETISNGELSAYVCSGIMVDGFTPKKPADTTPPKGKRFIERTVTYKALVTKKVIYEIPSKINVKVADAYIKKHGVEPITADYVSDKKID